MKKIATWSGRNRVTARLLIVLIKFTLAILAWATGRWMMREDVQLSPAILPALVVAMIFIGVVYPMTREKKRAGFLRWKLLDLSAAVISFLLIITVSNTGLVETSSGVVEAALVTRAVKDPTAEQILSSLKTRDPHSLTRKEKRILRREFHVQLKNYVVAKARHDTSGAGKAALILATILGAGLLLYLLAGLACDISCSGADGLAIVVLLVGLTGIILGTVAVIRRIKHGPRRRVEEPAMP